LAKLVLESEDLRRIGASLQSLKNERDDLAKLAISLRDQTSKASPEVEKVLDSIASKLGPKAFKMGSSLITISKVLGVALTESDKAKSG
jgi:hypothetical protein